MKCHIRNLDQRKCYGGLMVRLMTASILVTFTRPRGTGLGILHIIILNSVKYN